MANEKRLIDANHAIAVIKKYTPYLYHMVAPVIALYCPTVDAVEVVHGRWLYSEENECLICSNCEMSALNNYRGNSAHSDYCPNCGAKMDGDGNG